MYIKDRNQGSYIGADGGDEKKQFTDLSLYYLRHHLAKSSPAGGFSRYEKYCWIPEAT